jgi:hypothetical protein
MKEHSKAWPRDNQNSQDVRDFFIDKLLFGRRSNSVKYASQPAYEAIKRKTLSQGYAERSAAARSKPLEIRAGSQPTLVKQTWTPS